VINTILFRKTPLKAQNDYIFFKFGEGHGPFGPSGYAYEEYANFWGCEGFSPKFP